MTTYQVYCKGTSRTWQEYSLPYKTLQEALAVKAEAEACGTCTIFGTTIVYKVVRHIRQDVA